MKGKDILKAFSHLSESVINMAEQKKTLNSSVRFKRYSLIAASFLILVVSITFIQQTDYRFGKGYREGEYKGEAKKEEQKSEIASQEMKDDAKKEAKKADKNDVIEEEGKKEAAKVILKYNKLKGVTKYSYKLPKDSEFKDMTADDFFFRIPGLAEGPFRSGRIVFTKTDGKKSIYLIEAKAEAKDHYMNILIMPGSVTKYYSLEEGKVTKSKVRYIDIVAAKKSLENEDIYIADFTMNNVGYYLELHTKDKKYGEEVFKQYVKSIINRGKNNPNVLEVDIDFNK